MVDLCWSQVLLAMNLSILASEFMVLERMERE